MGKPIRHAAASFALAFCWPRDGCVFARVACGVAQPADQGATRERQQSVPVAGEEGAQMGGTGGAGAGSSARSTSSGPRGSASSCSRPPKGTS